MKIVLEFPDIKDYELELIQRAEMCLSEIGFKFEKGKNDIGTRIWILDGEDEGEEKFNKKIRTNIVLENRKDGEDLLQFEYDASEEEREEIIQKIKNFVETNNSNDEMDEEFINNELHDFSTDLYEESDEEDSDDDDEKLTTDISEFTFFDIINTIRKLKFGRMFLIENLKELTISKKETNEEFYLKIIETLLNYVNDTEVEELVFKKINKKK